MHYKFFHTKSINTILFRAIVVIAFLLPAVARPQSDSLNNIPPDSTLNAVVKVKHTSSPLLVDVQQLFDSLRQAGDKHIHKSNLYYRLGVTFAKMKMYPLALKCFYRSTQRVRRESRKMDTAFSKDEAFDTLMNYNNENIFQTAAGEAITIFGDTVLVNNVISNAKSKVVKGEDIIQPFDDKKEANAYGIIVHVKQPVRGKRKKIRLFHGDVGHTFITLIKYNVDGSNVARTFGFYPRVSLPLEATPLFPGTAADFKNDALHDWDESVGKFITKEQFDLIIDLTKKYIGKRYHLSKNNCTDFGLNIASIAGIYVKDTKGKWPLGSGNDPADMGQSIMENKVATSTGNLFICVEE